MNFNWHSGSWTDLVVGNKICGLLKDNKRPYKIELEREDLQKLLELNPKYLRSYLKMLMNGLANDN